MKYAALWVLGLCLAPFLVYALPDIPSFNDCPDIIYNSGFQKDSKPSNGSGGLAGYQTHTVFSQSANRTFYTYVPNDYNPQKAYPLLFAWHGSAGAGSAQFNARATRNFWQPSAEHHKFIVVAQAGTGSSGGWKPSVDLLIFADILHRVKALYNIENTRIYGEGFSAGGHLLHYYMLNNSLDYAAYIVRAGTLQSGAGISALSQSERRIPVYISIGSTDPYLPAIEVEEPYYFLAGWENQKNYWLNVFNGGHEHDLNVIWKSWEKICTFSTLN